MRMTKVMTKSVVRMKKRNAREQRAPKNCRADETAESSSNWNVRIALITVWRLRNIRSICSPAAIARPWNVSRLDTRRLSRVWEFFNGRSRDVSRLAMQHAALYPHAPCSVQFANWITVPWNLLINYQNLIVKWNDSLRRSAACVASNSDHRCSSRHICVLWSTLR